MVKRPNSLLQFQHSYQTNIVSIHEMNFNFRIPTELKIDETDDLKSEFNDRMTDVARETEKPFTVEFVFQPNPLSIDWNADNYSTDLDYEPSEDEKEEPVDNDNKLSNDIEQK